MKIICFVLGVYCITSESIGVSVPISLIHTNLGTVDCLYKGELWSEMGSICHVSKWQRLSTREAAALNATVTVPLEGTNR